MASGDETLPVRDAAAVDTAAATAGGAPALAPGGTIGRFVVVGALGAGGMGVVLAAFDPELDRKVAIKVLRHGGAGVEARLTLQREAQAMAKLAHPNAVTVYEVGRAGEQVFVAMELVDGRTLKAWLIEARRGWRETVAMFIGAGRGLQAAHDAGLVHRDFKPENVLIGQDGRPRVSDFGLAESGVHVDAAAVADLGRSLSVDGAVVGTPTYMAPEQWQGGEVDARSDQFAFCVALWMALAQQPPFAGDTVDELRAAVIAGRRRAGAPDAGRDVPGWLWALLDRGLAVEPARRWPSVAALLDALTERTTRRRRAWVLAAGAAAVVAAGGAALAADRGDEAVAEVCAPPSTRLDAVWGANRKASLATHLATIDPTYGGARHAAAAAVFDRAAPAWRAMFVEACRANRVENRQSDTVLDARMACLDRWLAGLDGAVRTLEGAGDAAALESAIKATTAITPLDGCADPDALLVAQDLPEAPAARAEAKAILAEVDAANADRRAGVTDGLAARVDAGIARARALGHDLTLSRAIAVRWRIAVTTGDIPGGLAFLRELTEVASRGGDDVEAAKTWSLMGRLTAQFQGQPDEARVMMLAARAAAARAGDPPLVRAEVLTNEADVLTAAGDADGALAALDQARQLLQRAGADQPGSPVASQLAGLLQSLGEAHWYAGRYDAALPPLREAIALFDRAFGPDTAEAAGVYLDVAQVLRDQETYPAALVAVDQAVRVRTRRDPDAVDTALAISTRASILAYLGRHAEALADAERAVALGAAALDPDDAVLLALRSTVGDVLREAGRRADAAAIYRDLLAIAARTGMDSANVAGWRRNLERLDARRP
ncbi:MAG: serine/threonine protein kinase [Myxococcales bacterium]|nr:serine/threonine protein kinase [Myxococcales bacterium]